jgi:lipid A disaccharide synthetase
MPELLQEAFTPMAVAERLEAWLVDSAMRSEAARKLDKAMEFLTADGDPLSIAAKEVMSCIKGC